MDLRVLRYFLTVSREKSIVKAANALHLTQPTLSRQLRDLEDEFGAKLFIRGNKSQGITLTDKGVLLRQRAEELVALADKTQAEMYSDDAVVSGDIMIGCGESNVIRTLAQTAAALQKNYPNIHYHLFSGNAEDVKERLDKGLLDFGVFVEPTDLHKYETFRLPKTDRWGLWVRTDSPLAHFESITAKELIDLPLIVSRQQQVEQWFAAWSGISPHKLNIVATYTLTYNAAFFVEEGFGNLIGLDKLVNTDKDSKIRFIPFAPQEEVHLDIAWKKYHILSKAAAVFLKKLRT